MSDPVARLIRAELDESRRVLDAAMADAAFLAALEAIGRAVAACLRAGGKVMLAGNGGSAADAQHIAAEFVGRYKKERRPLPAIALTVDFSERLGLLRKTREAMVQTDELLADENDGASRFGALDRSRSRCGVTTTAAWDSFANSLTFINCTIRSPTEGSRET